MPRRIDRRLTLWLQVVSLVAAAWFVSVNSILPRLGRETPLSVFGTGLFYAVFAAACAVAITLCTYFVVSRASLHGVRDPMKSISVAIWYAPAMLVASSFSPISVGASVILVISTTRVLVAKWTAPTRHTPSREYTPPSVLGWRMAIAIVASAAVHAGIFAIAGDFRLPATALLALSAAVLTALAIVTGAHNPRAAANLPHSIFGMMLTLLLALAITVIHGGDSDTPGDGYARVNPAKDADKADPRLPRDGDFPGVILATERPPELDQFVAPVLSQKKASEPQSHTLRFTGEYWLYRAPLSRPPEETSFHATGSLLDFSFSTTDGFPLLMEARQKLERPIDITCCSSFDVAITTADLIPGSAWLELSLIDSQNRRYGAFTVGRVGIPAGGHQVLPFSMPAGIFLYQFDEIRVVIRQARVINRSLKIQIEGFTLVPRA